MEQPPEDPVDVQVTLLGARMVERADELADALVARIKAAVPAYRTDAVVSTEELRATCRANIDFVFQPMGHTPAVSSPESRENGRRRARAGVPLTAVMDAYRVAARCLWDEFAQTATATADGASAEVVLRAASAIWLVQDTFAQEMAEGYREEITSQILSREQERSALVQALLEGRISDTNIWDAAEVLRIPARGPYAVVAAQAPKIGRHALPRAEASLRSHGVSSAWRLQHDAEVGIVGLAEARVQARYEHLAELLGVDGTSRVGISPPYDDLRDTANALALARVALRAAVEGHRVTVFDRAPMAIAAAAAPEVMRRVGHGILAALDQIPTADRMLLLDTFGAWLDNNGSANQTAGVLFCHPNTVRHRLRRLEEHTGRSLADPRAVAELCLAFEIDRRMTPRPDRRQPS